METTINTKDLADRIVPITYARRNFGKVVSLVFKYSSVIITKNGKPTLLISKIENKKNKI